MKQLIVKTKYFSNYILTACINVACCRKEKQQAIIAVIRATLNVTDDTVCMRMWCPLSLYDVRITDCG